MILGLDFPPISHLVEWPTIFGSGPFAVNKVVLLMWASVAIVFAVYFIGGRKRELVPTGAQNLAESTIEFIDDQIVMQTMGVEGLRFTPFLMTLFTFIFVCNIWEIIPGIQMPVTARIAVPIFLALLVYVIYNFVGIVRQGPISYLKNIMFIPGVPWPMYILLTPIELITRFITQPLSLAVRLFANLLAGHLLLVSFAVITQALFEATVVGAALPLALLIFLMGFEVLVSFLQAYIFTILAAVYIDAAMHPQH
ncbi:MAG TPA: F0F1 ATP synthase subunit A [Acidimicrobiales bacterium]|nr:F0F1 ATP synthase subunit A [Acidimicrobiales bacterium]